jgi:hypothetical protein
MDQLSGLPTHPLVVHLPVVLLPLAAIGVAVTLVRYQWYLRYRWITVGIGAAGVLGAILAASTGEGLEHDVSEGASQAARHLIHEHVEAGDMARTVSIVFGVILVLYAMVPWFLARRAGQPEVTDDGKPSGAGGPSWLRPVLMVLVALAAIGSVYTVINAGHTGATSVWEQVESGGA